MPKTYVNQRAEDLGIPVVDGDSHVFVAVTNHDVVNAKKANSKHCALSRAALRLPKVNAAYFFRNTAYLEYGDRIVRYKLPTSVQKEIVSFDRAKIFAPGVYQLSPVPPCDSPVNAKAHRDKVRARAKRVRRVAPRLAKLPSGLAEAISRVASTDPENATPEQREFEGRVAGIIGANAPTPLKPKRHLHRTQYVRGLNEPA